ncbi:MAG: glycosyltransferase family 39 protein [Acidobacteriota bacterium]
MHDRPAALSPGAGELRHPAALAALLAALLFLPGIGARDFWAPDEPRFAEVAREMLQSGDWLVLRDNDQLYTHKPPLLFWLIALVSLPFGEVTELSARLPIVACGVGTVWLSAALGRLWFGSLGGLAAGLLYATSYRGFLSAQWLQTDAPLALCTALSVYGLARVLERDRAGASDLALIYGGAAGALLAKGPVGLLVPLLCATGWALSERRPRLLRQIRPWLLAPAVLPVLLWGLATARVSPYSLAEALRVHVLERAMQGMHHPRPFYYYLISLPLELLPWTAFLIGWAVSPFALDATARAGRRRALIWLALAFAMFTLFTEKRPVYLLPMIPAACLLVAGAWRPDGWPAKGEPGRRRALAPFALLLLLSLLLLAAAPLAQRRLGGGGAAMAGAAVAALVAAALALRAARGGRGKASLWFASGASACLLLGLSLGAAPALDPIKSARPFCEQVSRLVRPDERLGMYLFYRSAYVFYTRRFVEKIDSPAELERFLGQAGAYCVLERNDYERLPAELRTRYFPLVQAQVGHRRMLLIGGGTPQEGSRNHSNSTSTPRPSSMTYSRLRTMRSQDQR